jgi:hypothetical protein
VSGGISAPQRTGGGSATAALGAHPGGLVVGPVEMLDGGRLPDGLCRIPGVVVVFVGLVPFLQFAECAGIDIAVRTQQ